MAVTVQKIPTNLVALPCNSKALTTEVTTDVDLEAVFKFKFIFALFRGQSYAINDIIDVFYISPNPQGVGVWDPATVLNKYVKADSDKGVVDNEVVPFWYDPLLMDVLGADTAHPFMFSKGDQAGFFSIKIGELYADDAITAPSATWLDEILGEEIWTIMITAGIVQDKYFTPDLGSTAAVGYLSDNNAICMADYRSGTLAALPSGRKVFVNIGEYDRFILSYLNHPDLSGVKKLFIVVSDADTSAFGPPVAISLDVDLATPPDDYASNGNIGLVNHVRCGPRDFNEMFMFALIPADNNPESNPTWAYYEVYFTDAANVRMGAIYRFYKVCTPKPYPRIQLMFQNIYGGWNFQGFHMKTISTIESQKKAYQQSIGNYSGLQFEVNQFTHQRGHFSSIGTKKNQLNSDWLTEEEAEVLQWYLLNRNPFMIHQSGQQYVGTGPDYALLRTDNIQVPVIVTDTSYEIGTRANRGMISVKATVENSHLIQTA